MPGPDSRDRQDRSTCGFAACVARDPGRRRRFSHRPRGVVSVCSSRAPDDGPGRELLSRLGRPQRRRSDPHPSHGGSRGFGPRRIRSGRRRTFGISRAARASGDRAPIASITRITRVARIAPIASITWITRIAPIARRGRPSRSSGREHSAPRSARGQPSGQWVGGADFEPTTADPRPQRAASPAAHQAPIAGHVAEPREHGHRSL